MISNDIQYNSFSLGVQQEAQINDETARRHLSFLNQCNTYSDYYNSGESLAPPEYENFFANKSTLKVLDIGVGRGESSVFLASKGHHVYCVEPSKGFCDLIRAASEKFKLNIHTYQTVAEDLDKISEKNFDVAIFNASLHHCDDPHKALKNVYDLLKNNGQVYLIFETHLRPWISKKWWYHKMQTSPVSMGHYGGNEHAYYNWEYKNMLKKAGYKSISCSPSFLFKDPLTRIENGLRTRINGKRMWGLGDTLSRMLFYLFVSKIVCYKPLFSIMSRASLVQTQFSGVK